MRYIYIYTYYFLLDAYISNERVFRLVHRCLCMRWLLKSPTTALRSWPGSTWSRAKLSSTARATPIKYGSLGGAAKTGSSGSDLTAIQPEKSAYHFWVEPPKWSRASHKNFKAQKVKSGHAGHGRSRSGHARAFPSTSSGVSFGHGRSRFGHGPIWFETSVCGHRFHVIACQTYVVTWHVPQTSWKNISGSMPYRGYQGWRPTVTCHAIDHTWLRATMHKKTVNCQSVTSTSQSACVKKTHAWLHTPFRHSKIF